MTNICILKNAEILVKQIYFEEAEQSRGTKKTFKGNSHLSRLISQDSQKLTFLRRGVIKGANLTLYLG